MSRWQVDFEQHPFQQIWDDLKTVSQEIEIDDKSIVTDLKEAARDVFRNYSNAVSDSAVYCIHSSSPPLHLPMCCHK